MFRAIYINLKLKFEVAVTFIKSGLVIDFLAPSFVWSKNINKANFENEVLLTEIALLIAISEKQTPFVPELKQNHRIGSFFLSAVIALFSLVTVTQLNAVPVLTKSFLTGGSAGVVTGSFDGGGAGLNDLSDLADTSAEPREYISQYFKPVISGSSVSYTHLTLPTIYSV